MRSCDCRLRQLWSQQPLVAAPPRRVTPQVNCPHTHAAPMVPSRPFAYSAGRRDRLAGQRWGRRRLCRLPVAQLSPVTGPVASQAQPAGLAHAGTIWAWMQQTARAKSSAANAAGLKAYNPTSPGAAPLLERFPAALRPPPLQGAGTGRVRCTCSKGSDAACGRGKAVAGRALRSIAAQSGSPGR